MEETDMIFKHSDVIFFMEDGDSDQVYHVDKLPDNLDECKLNVYYDINNYLYKYVGTVNSIRLTKKGEIFKYRGNIFVNTFADDDPEKENFNVRNAFISHPDKKVTAEDILNDYVFNYKYGHNIVKTVNSKVRANGGVYVPDLSPTDDALTRIMKLMIIHKKIVRNQYKDNYEKEYKLDNMISALNGSTVNMTITKFLDWCELLNLRWEFTLEDNGSDKLNPLTEKLVIASDIELTTDFGEPEQGIYKVPLSDKDDPLKRIIKVCIIKKHINLSDYKDKGSSPHLINNMRSALKRDSRMMIPYFIYWCEILGVDFTLSIYDKETDHTESAGVDYQLQDYKLDPTTDEE